MTLSAKVAELRERLPFDDELMFSGPHGSYCRCCGNYEPHGHLASCPFRIARDALALLSEREADAERLTWRRILTGSSLSFPDDRQFLVRNVAGYCAVATHVDRDGVATHWTAEGEYVVCSGVEEYCDVLLSAAMAEKGPRQ